MLFHHGTDAPSPSYPFSNRGLKSNYPWDIQLPGDWIFVCYFNFSALREVRVVKTELFHGGCGLHIPPTEPWSINNYAIVFSSNCSIFHNCWNDLLSCWCQRQDVLHHWYIFFDEVNAPKKNYLDMFVASPKSDVHWRLKTVSSMLS